jgi:hypothetical protein
LDHLLLGEKAQFLDPAERQLRSAAGVDRPRGDDAFERTLDLLFREADPCDLLEGTLLFAFFELAAEPARIRGYLHAKVEELEAALGTNIEDEVAEKLTRMILRKAQEFRGRVNCTGLGWQECAEAKRAAVDIHIVLPARSDRANADLLSMAERHEMLHLGVNIYRWNPARGWSPNKMLHSKVRLIDYEPGKPALTYVGSANLSQRSHLADNEMGILSTSQRPAEQVYQRVFRHDIERDTERESAENFHVVLETRRRARALGWLQYFLVSLFWLL